MDADKQNDVATSLKEGKTQVEEHDGLGQKSMWKYTNKDDVIYFLNKGNISDISYCYDKTPSPKPSCGLKGLFGL